VSLGGALHHELVPSGVAVTVLLPGNVETAVLDKLGVTKADLPVRPMSADAAVRESLAAFLRGRATHPAGRLLCLVARVVPRSARIRMSARMAQRGARALAARA
jgi:short-subunit dehydrogenase